MSDWRFLLIFPQLILVTLSSFEEIGITQTGWLPSILSFLLLVLSYFILLPLVDLKEEDIKKFKAPGISGFLSYLIINIVYFGILYYYRLSIHDMEKVYFIIGLSIVQLLIFMYFLSNLFSKKISNK